MAEHDPRKEAAWILFVYEKMSAGKISKELGIPEGTVNRWGYQEKWVNQRSHPPQPRPPMPIIPDKVTPTSSFITSTPIVPIRAVETIVTVVQDDPNELDNPAIAKWETLASEHEKSYKELRQYAQAQIRTLTRKTAKLQAIKDTDTLEAIALSLPVAKAATEWAKVLDLAIKGERVVTSAHYHDLNNAIGLIRKYGYDLVAPLPVDQPDETDSPESTQGISAETSDRILRESLGIEQDITELSEDLDS